MRGSGLLADAPTMDRLQILILFAKARKYKGTEKLPLKKWVFSVPLFCMAIKNKQNPVVFVQSKRKIASTCSKSSDVR